MNSLEARWPRISRQFLDFQGVAGLIDTVAGAEPDHLALLLQVLRSSEECLEARVVVELALQCRDPLAPHATLCRDAIKAAADFNRLLRSSTWRDLREPCPDARAAALLNLCDETLTSANPFKKDRRQRCREIRPRLKIAAVEEQNQRGEDIERVQAARAARCPGYWPQLRAFLADTISNRA